MSFAGLWDKWASPDGSELHSCTIITTSANATLRPIHERMPVILHREAVDTWLSDTADTPLLKSLLVPYDGKLQAWPVSKLVNSPTNNFAEILESAI